MLKAGRAYHAAKAKRNSWPRVRTDSMHSWLHVAQAHRLLTQTDACVHERCRGWFVKCIGTALTVWMLASMAEYGVYGQEDQCSLLYVSVRNVSRAIAGTSNHCCVFVWLCVCRCVVCA